MTDRPESYWFEVRETTVRTARVDAPSAVEARQLLQSWCQPGNDLQGLDNVDSPISLSDMDSERFTFRNMKAPE